MKNINPFEPSEIYVEITVEKKQYVFNAKLAICDLKKIKHQFIDKRAKAYRPCVDSPLYDVRTLGDMRQYIETHGSSTAKNTCLTCMASVNILLTQYSISLQHQR